MVPWTNTRQSPLPAKETLEPNLAHASVSECLSETLNRAREMSSLKLSSHLKWSDEFIAHKSQSTAFIDYMSSSGITSRACDASLAWMNPGRADEMQNVSVLFNDFLTDTTTVLTSRCTEKRANYTCPRCSIEYCSLACFKDEKHRECSERFYASQVKEALGSERVSQVSDDREAVLDILRRMQQLDQDSEDEPNDEHSSLVDKFSSLDLDTLTAEEFETLLGEEHMAQLQKLLETGVSREWLEIGQLESSPPWFRTFDPSVRVMDETLAKSVPQILANIPPLSQLTKAKPSDFLWNSLLELAMVYVLVYSQFSAGDLADPEVLELEVRPIVLEMAASLHRPAAGEPPFYYSSAIDALEAAAGCVAMNAGDFDVSVELDSVKRLVGDARMLLPMLSDMHRWFVAAGRNSDAFFAEKKLLFLLAWLTQEMTDSPDAARDILNALSLIIDRFGETLADETNAHADQPAADFV